MKLASLINLKALKEGSMQARELADRNSLQQLQSMYDQLMRDMEQEAEPEGGPIADQYADQMQDIEDAMQIKRGGSGGEMTYGDMLKKHGLNEATEKSWNSIDVSRKAEKEIDNKEWNSRTTKKLDMLIALNKAGKFKKDWDEEKLQGWVDQNYSWEKLSRQFKLNEIKKSNNNNLITERFQELAGIKPLYTEQDKDQYGRTQADRDWEQGKTPQSTPQPSATIKKVVNLKMDSEVGEPVTVEYDPKKNLRDVTISWGNESHTVDFEAEDTIDDHGNEGLDLETIANSDDGRWQFILDVYAEATYPMTGDFAEWDFDELIVQGHPDNEDHLEPEDRFDQDPQFEGQDPWSPRTLGNSALQVTTENGVVAIVEDPKDIEAYDRGLTVIGTDADGKEHELNIDWSRDSHMTANEGSCGYSQEAPGGKDLKTPGGTKGMPANKRTMTMMREVIRKEIAKLSKESDDKKSDDEGPDHGKLSKSGEFRKWDKKTDMMGNPRGTTHKDKNAWGFPKKK